MKKVRFGKGKWNGFGGHVEPGESIEDAARRETKEEAGIVVEDLEKIGVNEFRYLNGAGGAKDPDVHEVHIFRATRFSGTPTESDEMRPAWFDDDKLPFDAMWPSDRLWYPLFLTGQKFKGTIVYSDYETIMSHVIDKISV